MTYFGEGYYSYLVQGHVTQKVLMQNGAVLARPRNLGDRSTF